MQGARKQRDLQSRILKLYRSRVMPSQKLPGSLSNFLLIVTDSMLNPDRFMFPQLQILYGASLKEVPDCLLI